MNRKYNNPAVREAIFEIKFSEDHYDEATPGQLFEHIKDEFPTKRKVEVFEFTFGAVRDNSKPQIPIMQAWKEDESALIQVGDGIIVANCIQYKNWEAFQPIVQRALNSYISLTEPQGIKRIGTRYINVFNLPEGSLDITKYFTLGIRLPDTMETLNGFDLTFLHETDGLQVKTKFLTSQERSNSFVLDIDCFTNEETEVGLDNILTIGTKAHDVLKTVFESFITDQTRNIMEVKCQP